MIPALAAPFSWGARTTSEFRTVLHRTVTAIAQRAAAWLRRVSTEQWWLLLFVSLFLAFFVALLFQPGIGRGGR